MPSPRAEISDTAVSPDHFIGGRRVPSDDTFEVRSPLDWDWHLADIARGDALTADLAVTAAVDAFPGWASLTPERRAEHLFRLADAIDQNIGTIAGVECVDMAMLLESLEARVIHRGAENFRNYAELSASHRGRRWSSKGTDNHIERMPAGLLQLVGETGWQLSHGERSRLFIARALLSGADLLVLDESFAALDPATLRGALGLVLERAGTLIVIAHP